MRRRCHHPDRTTKIAEFVTRCKMERIGKLRLSAILIAILVSVGLIWSNVWRPHVPSNSSSRQSQNDRNDELKFRAIQVSLPYQSARGGFIGSTGCRDCHREQFESWHGTFHRTMTQIATCEACHGPGQKHKNFPHLP